MPETSNEFPPINIQKFSYVDAPSFAMRESESYVALSPALVVEYDLFIFISSATKTLSTQFHKFDNIFMIEIIDQWVFLSLTELTEDTET